MANRLDKTDFDRLINANPNDPAIPDSIKNQSLAVYRPAVGLAMANDGRIFKTRAADKLELDEERYNNYLLTREELNRVEKYMRNLRWGINAVVPVVCTGEQCPFKADCPYFMIGKAPVGLPCLVEEDILEYYTEAFAYEYGVLEDSPTDKLLVQELAELMVYEMRVTRILSKAANAELTQIDTVGYDSEGEPIKQETIHRAWEIKERCKNRRMKIFDALVGTRREQYKKAAALKEKGGEDIASMSSELSELIRDIKKRKINQQDIQEAEIVTIYEHTESTDAQNPDK